MEIQENNTLLKRPTELACDVVRFQNQKDKWIAFVGLKDGRPYEIFINTKNLQYFSWIVAMTRLISSVFRHDPAPKFLVDELKSIYDPNGGYFSDGTYIPSLAADIGRIIERHLGKIGIMPAPQIRGTPQRASALARAGASSPVAASPTQPI